MSYRVSLPVDPLCDAISDLLDLLEHHQHLSPRVGINVDVLVVVVMTEIELVHLKAAESDDQNRGREKEKRLIKLAELSVKNIECVAARYASGTMKLRAIQGVL